jgi:hypothetical protein
MKPTIRISPVASSWTIAGAKPSILAKSIFIAFSGLPAQRKSPPRFHLSAGSNLRIALDLYLASLRRHLRPMVVMVAMMDRRKHRGKYKEE